MKNSTSHWAVMVNLNAEHGLYLLLMALIEGRNPELGHYLKRIQKLAALFSQFKELTIKETEFLVIGAGIHDVGMLLINDYIVNKPSKLTKSEYSLVQKHVDFGFKILT
ncbi:putative two-component system response regulator [Nitrosomonas marina]|uniref:Putative two-component system response regulator n=1 Tax=Nitrosomonas marina TaxID=917 RepID=A0A1I0G599_9PROT|nr:hypothetical protein [Nitrosomonas marina]SET65925.1 putative two-component system response regulator [Nitrosomonas marina]